MIPYGFRMGHCMVYNNRDFVRYVQIGMTKILKFSENILVHVYVFLRTRLKWT